jgi:2-oxoisovalerate ferredoxin oxidoreductase beta subunit
MIKFNKPKSLYTDFLRKGTGTSTSHYCPGCGHGIVHKLIARAIDKLGVQDRTIMCSPVGCSVFLYYYFDTGNIQCSHGRAPAVATGMARSIEDAVIVSYQGDGDLAAIGTAEIIHAANRGENIAVFFVNNAVYGMTGGQMAPTSLVGQKTTTTPDGRSVLQDGGPIGMSELLNALPGGPILIERVSLASPSKIMRAEKAILKALTNQVEKKGFSFVEILSPCPINWKMDPVDALDWIEKQLEPVYPVKIFRDTSTAALPHMPFRTIHPWLDDKALLAFLKDGIEKTALPPPRLDAINDISVKICGFGGQGVMVSGILLANCASAEGLHATWLPSYGPEMRGGTANASIVISQNTIGSPVVNTPDILIAMNTPSLETFEGTVPAGGAIFVNSSIIPQKVKRVDVRAIYVPASDLAKEIGFIAGANILMLTVYALIFKSIGIETIRAIIPQSIKKPQFIDMNLKIVDRALRFFKEDFDKHNFDNGLTTGSGIPS